MKKKKNRPAWKSALEYTLRFIIMFLLTFFSVILVGIPLFAKIYNSAYMTPIVDNINTCANTSIQYINDVAWNFTKSRNYSKEYDCTNFSIDLVKELWKSDIGAYCVSGRIRGIIFPMHTWVESRINGKVIPIEATGGYVISDEEYKEKYIPQFYGRCL